MSELQREMIKQARVILISAQQQFRAYTEDDKKIDDLLVGIEDLLGIK